MIGRSVFVERRGGEQKVLGGGDGKVGSAIAICYQIVLLVLPTKDVVNEN